MLLKRNFLESKITLNLIFIIQNRRNIVLSYEYKLEYASETINDIQYAPKKSLRTGFRSGPDLHSIRSNTDLIIKMVQNDRLGFCEVQTS